VQLQQCAVYQQHDAVASLRQHGITALWRAQRGRICIEMRRFKPNEF
jgi:hypothetical protein